MYRIHSIQQLKNDSIKGQDGLPADFFKFEGDELLGCIHQLIKRIGAFVKHRHCDRMLRPLKYSRKKLFVRSSVQYVLTMTSLSVKKKVLFNYKDAIHQINTLTAAALFRSCCTYEIRYPSGTNFRCEQKNCCEERDHVYDGRTE